MTYRLAIVASHVIQYQDPFFRLLAGEREIDLTVIYCSADGAQTFRDEDMKTTLRWDINLLQGYRHKTLRNYGFGNGYTRLINPRIVSEIIGDHYDAVIFMLGWGSISALLGILACRISQTPFFLYGDSSFPPPETTLRDKMRTLFIRAVFRLATGFMTSGSLNAEYYQHYGGDPASFFLLPWAVDNERFREGSQFAPGERDEMRLAYGIDRAQIVFLFSAKLVPRKDPGTLIRAFQQMRCRERAALVFMGDGELRAMLEAYAREQGLDRQVHFIGFVNQSDLPRHYAMCDVFVLPSLYEPRGAVINEAMACGLPVVVTDRCGSIGDIVVEGENAIIYQTGDAASLANAMDLLVTDDLKRITMGRRSSEIIQTWDFARGVQGVKAMLGREISL